MALYRFSKRRLQREAVLLVGLAVAAAAAQGALVSGEPLRAGAEGGGGLLAAPRAITTKPAGCAKVYGGARPDLFVCAPTGIDTALLLYRWTRDTPEGVPVFAPPVKVGHPFGEKAPPDGTIWQDAAGAIHGFWVRGKTLTHSVFDREALAFRETARVEIAGLPRTASALAVLGTSGAGVELVAACYNGAKYRPDGDAASLQYVLYDGSGAYRGKWPRTGLFRFRLSADGARVAEDARLFSPSADEILGGVRLTAVTYPGAAVPTIVAGASIGNFYAFETDRPQAADKRPLAGPDGVALRHPTIGNAPVAYPDAAGRQVDLIAGGEGALYYYAYAGRDGAEGGPLYRAARPVLQTEATLYAGSLAVPSVVDWDGDGAHDLVVGNSEGRVLFFKNRGTDREPRFGLGEPLLAAGQAIHVQPGYYGIQGPFENRWGYACPAVADWNGDGLPDLLLSGATARHEVYLNVGTRQTPALAAGRALYCDGLELHGTWRVRPGVTRVGGRMAYVIQDDANAFRLYWRLDDVNLEDGGPLRLADGTGITSHTPEGTGGPGQRGRSKIAPVDWDGDGTLDLLVGTVKRGCLPDPQRGLPWALRQNTGKGLQVLFFRNVGSNREPRYERPGLFQFKGEDFYLGGHSNAPEPCPFGDTSQGPNLLVGAEDGRIYFFSRAHLTLDPRTAGAADASGGRIPR